MEIPPPTWTTTCRKSQVLLSNNSRSSRWDYHMHSKVIPTTFRNIHGIDRTWQNIQFVTLRNGIPSTNCLEISVIFLKVYPIATMSSMSWAVGFCAEISFTWLLMDVTCKKMSMPEWNESFGLHKSTKRSQLYKNMLHCCLWNISKYFVWNTLTLDAGVLVFYKYRHALLL